MPREKKKGMPTPWVSNPELDAWLERQRQIKTDADNSWPEAWRRFLAERPGINCDGFCGAELKPHTRGVILMLGEGRRPRLLCGACGRQHQRDFGEQSGWAGNHER